MSVALRYAGFALLVLFAVAVSAVCGEAACEACLHACCGKVDRAERIKQLVAQVLDVGRPSSARHGAVYGAETDPGLTRTRMASLAALSGVSLRI